MRVIFERTLLFLLPFAAYFGFFLLTQARPPRAQAPWLVLVIAGLMLVAASFVYLGLTQGESTSGVYVPPHMQNGTIVPGHVEKKPG